jgi:hypothetical protein
MLGDYTKMSKKTLLSESQVRQFMKLAKLTPLTPGFVEGLTNESHGRGRGEGDAGYGSPDNNTRLEEDEEAELHATEDELGDMDDDVHDKDEEIDDLESDLDAADAGDGADQMISVGDLMDALTSALEDVTGQPVEASVEDEVEADVELDAADDLEVDAADMEADTEMEMDDMLQEEEGSKKGEYRRKDKDGKVGKRAGEGKDGHYKDYEGPEGGNKDDESKTDKGDKDYTWRKGGKSKSDPGTINKEGVEATDALVEQITKRVAARILKSALAKK